MNTRNTQETETEESIQKYYSVHNDIIFITEYVAIDQDEPLEIIQCSVDIGEGKEKILLATR